MPATAPSAITTGLAGGANRKMAAANPAKASRLIKNKSRTNRRSSLSFLLSAPGFDRDGLQGIIPVGDRIDHKMAGKAEHHDQNRMRRQETRNGAADDCMCAQDHFTLARSKMADL